MLSSDVCLLRCSGSEELVAWAEAVQRVVHGFFCLFCFDCFVLLTGAAVDRRCSVCFFQETPRN